MQAKGQKLAFKSFYVGKADLYRRVLISILAFGGFIGREIAVLSKIISG
jgi:hypothetical protein